MLASTILPAPSDARITDGIAATAGRGTSIAAPPTWSIAWLSISETT
jgi:hypothetical protein